MPIIVFESGPQQGQTVRISPGESLLFGRDPSAPVPLLDNKASRSHFRIKEHKGQYFLRDLKSTNGTRVNDQPVGDFVRLRYEDRIQVGGTVAAFLPEPAAKTDPDLGGRDPGATTDVSIPSPSSSSPPSVSEEATDEPTPVPAPPPRKNLDENDPLVGRTLGGYELLSVVGKGGMGTVYLANQLSLHREVALKVLSKGMTEDETFIQLFFQEARAAGQLNHPNIVQVYDVAQEENLYFYSMEYLPQGSVEDLLSEAGAISIERATAVVLDAARGLVYAERKKLVHRDIKPENLMIGEDGIIKIADLGLAKSLAEGSGKAGKEGILGTPHFISPEQARGKDVDTRSDLYSLGASFYRLISGRTPFVAKRVKEIVRAQINETPTPIQDIVPEVPDDVAAVLEQLMEKDPEDRFQSAEELVLALEEIQRVHHYGDGKGRSRSIIFASLIIAAAIVITAVFLVKSPDTNSSNDSNQATLPTPKPGPDPNLEKTQSELLEARAEVAFQAAAMKEQSEGKTQAVVKSYREVARLYEQTSWGKKAWERVGSIDQELKTIELENKRRNARAKSALEQVTRGIEQALGTKSFVQALVIWSEFSDRDMLTSHDALAPDYLNLQKRVVDGSRAWWQELSGQAEASRQAGEIEKALTLAARGRDHEGLVVKSSDPAPFAEIVAIRAEASALYDAILVDRNRVENEAYDRDRQLFLETYRKARGRLRALDFSGAVTQWDSVEDRAETEAYRTVIKAWSEAYREASSTHDTGLATLAKNLQESTIPVTIPNGPNRGKPGELTQINSQGLVVTRTVSRQRVTDRFSWNDYTDESLKYFIDLLSEAGRQGGVSLDRVALVAALLGEYQRAESVMPRLRTGGGSPDPTTPSPQEDPIRQFVARELLAERLYQSAKGRATSGSYQPALDDLEIMANQYATTSAFLTRTDGSSDLVKRVHYLGPTGQESQSPSTGDGSSAEAPGRDSDADESRIPRESGLPRGGGRDENHRRIPEETAGSPSAVESSLTDLRDGP